MGYMIGSWNAASGAYAKKDNWDDDETNVKMMIIQSVNTAGSAVGALFSGSIASLGRWKCIQICNAVLVVGVCITFVDVFSALCVGKFIYGVAVGAIMVFCPKFISETAPIEVKGPAGGLTQVSLTFGILVAFALGLGIGDVDADAKDSFEI